MHIKGLVNRVLKKAKENMERREYEGEKLDGLDRAILETLGACFVKERKDYVRVTQEKLLELLAVYHQYYICRRTLCYRLKKLECLGFIKRVVFFSSRGRGEIYKKVFFFLLEKTMRLFAGIAKFGRKLISRFSSVRAKVTLWEYRRCKPEFRRFLNGEMQGFQYTG